jgi:hypothetical protein
MINAYIERNFRIVCLLALMCGGKQFVYSQQLLPQQQDSTLYKSELILYGLGEYFSSSIQNNLVSRFVLGGNISTEMKASNLSQHNKFNRFGVNSNLEFEYRQMNCNIFRKEKIGFLIKGGDYAVGGLEYSDDLFNLAMNGNEGYSNKSASFSGTSGAWMKFQKIGFGIVDKKMKSTFSINFYNAQSYFKTFIREGSYQGATDTSSFNFDLKGDFEFSSSKKAFNGIGVGLDFDIRLPVQWNPTQKVFFQVLAKNIGIVSFEEITSYRADSSYTFSGFSINDLMSSSNFSNDLNSTLDSLGLEKRTGASIRFLPGFIQIGKMVDENTTKKMQSFFGIRLYPSLPSVPLVFGGVDYRLMKHTQIGTQFSFGGFSNLNWGIYTNTNVNKFSLGIGTQNLIGLVSSSGYGKSLIIRLRCRFD